jgi:hypothetical protein
MHPHEGNGSPEDRRLQIAVAGGSIGGLCAGRRSFHRGRNRIRGVRGAPAAMPI